MPEYIMYRIEHPPHVRRGGTCIYYKTMMPLKVLSTNSCQEIINFEITIENKICRFNHHCRSPSQFQDKFHDLK